jgi:hypothetical protein
MRRFLLSVSFVVALLFAFAASTVFAGQDPAKGGDRQYKQRDLAKFSSLSKALQTTQTPSDKKVGTKSKQPNLKSTKSKATSKKLASTKSSSSNKDSYKKGATSKSKSYRKAKSLKKPVHRKKKSTKTT